MQILLQQQLKQIVVHGNSATATKLATKRKISLTGAVTGNVDFDGAGNVEILTKQANIKILTGSINVAAESTSTTDISYPSGFTKDNALPIAFGNRTIDTKEWNYGFGEDNSGSSLNGGGSKLLIMNADKIRIGLTNISTTQKTYYYKIILMKI